MKLGWQEPDMKAQARACQAEQDFPIKNQSVRENRVGTGARKAWGDFSAMHQELEKMSRLNAEMLGLQVLQAKAASRAGSIEGPNIQGEIFRSLSGLGYLKLQ